MKVWRIGGGNVMKNFISLPKHYHYVVMKVGGRLIIMGMKGQVIEKRWEAVEVVDLVEIPINKSTANLKDI